MSIGLGLLLDIMKWAQIANNRRGIPGYPQGTAGTPAADIPATPAAPLK